jgi:hypothetical protein
MKKLITSIVFVAGAFISGCYSYGGWQPTVDSYNDPNAYRINQDIAECKQLASQASGGTAKETAIGAGTGALIGAAGGAIAGAFLGNPGTGAAGFGGAAKQGFGSEDTYKRAYSRCMSGRGHRTIN